MEAFGFRGVNFTYTPRNVVVRRALQPRCRRKPLDFVCEISRPIGNAKFAREGNCPLNPPPPAVLLCGLQVQDGA